jgi:hypothetical protein
MDDVHFAIAIKISYIDISMNVIKKKKSNTYYKKKKMFTIWNLISSTIKLCSRAVVNVIQTEW